MLNQMDKVPESKKEKMLFDMYNPDCGDYATIEDLIPLQKLILSIFDPKVDHLYSNDELREMIENK